MKPMILLVFALLSLSFTARADSIPAANFVATETLTNETPTSADIFWLFTGPSSFSIDYTFLGMPDSLPHLTLVDFSGLGGQPLPGGEPEFNLFEELTATLIPILPSGRIAMDGTCPLDKPCFINTYAVGIFPVPIFATFGEGVSVNLLDRQYFGHAAETPEPTTLLLLGTGLLLGAGIKRLRKVHGPM